MPFMTGLGEKIAISLAVKLVEASAGKVRKLFSASETQKALQRSIATALDKALAAQDLEKIYQDHYSTLFEEFFQRDAVVDELSQLLDPRPDLELDFKVLAREFQEAGGDADLIEHFDLDAFLRTFASELYAAAAGEEALQGRLEMKLLGEMVKRMGSVAHASERTASATERMTGLLQRFLEDRAAEPALLQAGREARDQGVLAAFQAFEGIAAAMFKAGFDFGVGRSGAIEIGGDLKLLPPAQAETIRTLAGELRQTVIETDPSPTELDALEERYRQHIIRWFESLQFQGLVRTPRPILLPLEEVYVELRAVAEVPEAADAFSVEERRLLLELDEKDHTGRRELMSQLDALRRERWSRTLPERKSIAETLHQRDRRAFVLLGDPGSGKTTLLHFLALVYARGPAAAAERLKVDPAEADRLPIFVPLAAFDDMLRESGREGRSLTLLEFLPRYYDRRRGLPGLEPLFRRALESGRALVLLDGLDEVLDVGTRTYVAQQAGALIGEWSPRGVRFAVSSRFVGYREAPVPGNLPTLSVLDFGPPEIELFVHRWAHAYEKWAAQGVESPEMLRSARQLEADLLVDVRSNESVRRLAANPLMLTMLALLRRQVGKLPHRRVQLYESYAGALLETWIDARNPGARERSVEIIDRHHAENLLLPLALWLQKEKPSGTAGGTELRRKLTEICLAESGLTEEKANLPQRRGAEEQADRFLREMRQMTGLLVERGHDAYGLLHLTFQEYFAGRALASLSDEERWKMVRPHLHDPRWRESILLCAGRLGVVENRRPQVTAFVRSILEHADPTEEKLHRNLLLALAVAGDDVNLDSPLVSELAERAAACLPTRVYALARDLVGALGQLVANGAMGAECFERIWADDDGWLRMVTVEALSSFTGAEEIRRVLLARLGDQDSLVVPATLGALSSQVTVSDQVRRAVMAKLDDPNVSVFAVEALSTAAGKDMEICTAMLAQLANENFFARQTAIRALSSRVGLNEEVRSAILPMLQDPFREVRKAAIQALSDQARLDKEVRRAILAMLEDPVSEVRDAAIQMLAGLAGTDAAVREKIAVTLCQPETWLSQAAVGALKTVPGMEDAIRRAVFANLKSQCALAREHAIEALLALGTAEEVRVTLLKILETATADDKSAAMRGLSGLLSCDPQIFAAVHRQAKSVDWSTRSSVAETLGSSIATAKGLEILTELSENRDAPESFTVLEEVASAAPDFLKTDPRWRPYYLSKIAGEHPWGRAAALVALTGLSDTDAEVRKAVLQRLEDEEFVVRSFALDSLSVLVGTDTEVRQAVMQRLDDEDVNVQSSALGALSGVLGTDEEVRQAVLRRLRDKNHYIDLSRLSEVLRHDAEVRQVVLWRLEAENHDIQLYALGALAGVVEIDAEVRQMFLLLLGDESYALPRTDLSALSNVVGTDAEIRQSILRRLESEDPYTRSSALSALSGLVGTDAQMQQAVLERLDDESPDVRCFALEALSDLAGLDAAVWHTVLQRLDDWDFHVRLSAVEVIAGGPPEFIDIALLDRLRPWLATNGDNAFQARARLASLFGSRIADDSSLRGWLLNQLQASRWSARAGAMLSLLTWSGGPPADMLDRIFEALDDRRGLEAYPAQLTAASFLINRDKNAHKVIDLCLEAMDYGTQPWEYIVGSEEVRQQAALVLGKLEPVLFEKRVYDRLLTAMEYDESLVVRDAAYGALVRLARAA